MPVKSLITHPATGHRTAAPALEVRGHAWAGDATVDAVRLSIDFGATWSAATLDAPVNANAWQNWRAAVEFPGPGYYEVWATATDSEGRKPAPRRRLEPERLSQQRDAPGGRHRRLEAASPPVKILPIAGQIDVAPPAPPPHVRIAMTATLRQLAALLLGTAILFTGNGLINTLLPVRAEIEAFSTLEIGLLGTVYFAGFILGCLNVPFVVRRVGHIRTFATLSSIIAATALAHVFLIDPIAWGVLRLFVGFAFAGLYVVIESWLNDRATTANRGAVMSAYTFISLCVLMAGQFLLTTYDPAGFELFALIAILIAIALVPVSLTRAPEPPRPATIGLDIVGLWRLSPVGFIRLPERRPCQRLVLDARADLREPQRPRHRQSGLLHRGRHARRRRRAMAARLGVRPDRPALRDRRSNALRGYEWRPAQHLGRAVDHPAHRALRRIRRLRHAALCGVGGARERPRRKTRASWRPPAGSCWSTGSARRSARSSRRP